jgi:hypothetical protein
VTTLIIPMRVYAIGHNDKSTTANKVIITIELLSGITNTAGLTLSVKDLHTPFYRALRIDSGRVERITDLECEYDFTSATADVNLRLPALTDTAITADDVRPVNARVELPVSKYFYINNAPGEDNAIVAYQHRSALLEQTYYVARGYTGVHYRHYENGLVANKKYYSKGQISADFMYRNDAFNTLMGVHMYKGGILECQYQYDSREALVGQVWYDSSGKVYSNKHIVYTPQSSTYSYTLDDTYDSECSASNGDSPTGYTTNVVTPTVYTPMDSDVDSDSDEPDTPTATSATPGERIRSL